MYKRVIFGEIANPRVAALTDLNAREFIVLALLGVAVLALGVYPKPVTDLMHASVGELLQHVAQSKLPPAVLSGN
jgi:NADH-quinone oxidoreductase subunit M